MTRENGWEAHDGANECPKCGADGPGQHCVEGCPYDVGEKEIPSQMEYEDT